MAENRRNADCREQLIAMLRSSGWHMETLRVVRSLRLPDWAVGAGFIRNVVWDHLHEYSVSTPLDDVDVLFYDPAAVACDPAYEAAAEAQLRRRLPDRPWSVRNQARMHHRNADPPYHGTLHAMAFWLETPTTVAVRLEDDETLSVLAPFGLSDLFSLRARPTAAGLSKPDQYASRMRAKNWTGRWPRVVVEMPASRS